MAEAEEKHFTYDAGDDEVFNLTFDQDISGWTIKFSLKNTDISKEITSHGDATNGKTSFTLTSTETSNLSGSYNYEMTYTTDSDTDETFLKGRMDWV